MAGEPLSRTARGVATAAALGPLACLLAACGPGPAGDDAASQRAEVTLNLVAFGAAEHGWEQIIPAFEATPAGSGVDVTADYGPSTDQALAVLDGEPADIVNFSAEPEVRLLVDSGQVVEDFNADVTRGAPFGSVVSLVVRSGNPKGVTGWGDLLRPGIGVVTPSPLTSGAGRWNLLAAYAAAGDGGRDQRAGLDYVGELLEGRLSASPASAADAAEAFLGGAGDVLISYESEAVRLERAGAAVARVMPAQTLRVDSALAVTTTSRHPGEAVALRNFLFTEPAQRIWAKAGFRPVDPAVAAEYEAAFPAPTRIWTIADLGGWGVVQPALLAADTGAITAIFREATG